MLKVGDLKNKCVTVSWSALVHHQHLPAIAYTILLMLSSSGNLNFQYLRIKNELINENPLIHMRL